MGHEEREKELLLIIWRSWTLYKIVSNPLNICQASKDYENVTETECPLENRYQENRYNETEIANLYQENRMVTFSLSTESVDLAEYKTGNGEINQEDDITDKNVPTSV